MVKKFICLLFFICGTRSFCHPHIFFESFFLLNIKDDTITTLDITLYLDEVNTVVLAANLPKDSPLSKNDISFLEDVTKDIHVYLNSKSAKKDIRFKSAEIENDNLKVELSMIINKRVSEISDIVFFIYDKEYFYTYEYSKENLMINLTNSAYSAKFSLKENLQKPFYYGMVYPNEYEVKFY